MTAGWNAAMRTRLKAQIRRAGLTQVAVARQAGISPSHLANILSKDSEPGAVKLQTIAEAAGTTVDYILTGAHCPTPEPVASQLTTLARLFEQLATALSAHSAPDFTAASEINLSPIADFRRAFLRLLRWLFGRAA